MFLRSGCAIWGDISDVLVDRDSGEADGEDVSSPRIRLTEEGVSKPSSGKSEVESADAGEEGADDIHAAPWSDPAARRVDWSGSAQIAHDAFGEHEPMHARP